MMSVAEIRYLLPLTLSRTQFFLMNGMSVFYFSLSIVKLRFNVC